MFCRDTSSFLTGIPVLSDPHVIPQDVELLIDTAPIERWNLDILTTSGHANLTSIFDYIKGSF